MEQLYKQNKGFINKLAKKYAYTKEDINDLMQEAYFGLHEAVQRYDEKTGVLFISYASFWIRQAMIRYLENNGRNIRLSNDMYNKIMQYRQLLSSYEMQLGRKPTDDELCKYFGSRQQVDYIKRAYHGFYSMGSLDVVIPGNDDDMQLSDVLADPMVNIENDVVDGLIEESKRTELWQIVKDNVSPDENEVINARYRIGMSFDATGKYIGKTRDVARQLEAKALRKLRKRKAIKLIEEKFELNYARAYRGSLSLFESTWSSIVEDIAIKNMEAKLLD
jgi:RNA polymerase primary sigma factor